MREIVRLAKERGEVGRDAATRRRLEAGHAALRQHLLLGLIEGAPIGDDLIVDNVILLLLGRDRAPHRARKV
jgi:hypothetical protein